MLSQDSPARAEADFDEFAQRFPAVEVLNGQMLSSSNYHAEAFAARHRKIAVAGSDSHTLAALGQTYTQVHGARDCREFLDGLKQGTTAAFGEAGNYGKFTRAVLEIYCGMMREQQWTRWMAPLLAGVPLVVLAIVLRELAFAQHWRRCTARLSNPVTSVG